MNEIGPQVRRIRKERGYTQAQLAARCARYGLDVVQDKISKIESQRRTVTDREVIAIAKALKVQPGELF